MAYRQALRAERARRPEFRVPIGPGAGVRGGLSAIAGDIDGIDGGVDTLKRMAQAEIDAQTELQDNNSFAAFEAIGQLVTTGRTLMNVNDLCAILDRVTRTRRRPDGNGGH